MLKLMYQVNCADQGKTGYSAMLDWRQVQIPNQG